MRCSARMRLSTASVACPQASAARRSPAASAAFDRRSSTVGLGAVAVPLVE